MKNTYYYTCNSYTKLVFEIDKCFVDLEKCNVIIASLITRTWLLNLSKQIEFGLLIPLSLLSICFHCFPSEEITRILHESCPTTITVP